MTSNARKRLRLRGALALAVVLAVPAGAYAIDAPAAPTGIRPSALAPRIPSSATRVGSLSGARPLTFAVVLAPSHRAELNALLRDQYDPRSARYRQWLATGEFRRRFGPSPDRVAAVTGWLHGAGFSDARLVDGRIEVRTTAARAARGLQLSFGRFRLPDGTERFSADDAPLVPRAVASDVTAVVGLSGVARLQPYNRPGPRFDTSAARVTPYAASCAKSIERQANELRGWSTRQTGARYEVPALHKVGLTGKGTTIAIYSLAPHTSADVKRFLNCFGLKNPITRVEVDGGADDFGGGTLEANLDIQAAAVTAPGAKVISYEGPNTQLGYIHVWSRIINDNIAQVISTSWGICEPLESPSERAALHALFQQAAAQGQPIFSASGDSGSEGCLFHNESTALAVDSPSHDPLVTGVGGTSLLYKAPSAPWREPVWNDCQAETTPVCGFTIGGAGGGGASKVFTRPAWQPPSECANCRGVPDISANSGIGEAFAWDGHWSLVGGTSIAAPRLAGIAADVTSGCTSRLGSFNPPLYRLARLGSYGTALRDVPAGSGDNDLTRNRGHRYQSRNGYDLATGLGTPLATGLACPQVGRVRPSSAPAGARVVVEGMALQHATVRFGGQAATVVRRSARSLTVLVPPGAGKVAVRATGKMGAGTFRAPFTYAP
jgi:subtilase family serine protease